MFCEKCGKELREDDVFCTACGTPVEKIVIDNKKENKVADATSKKQSQSDDLDKGLEGNIVERKSPKTVIDRTIELKEINASQSKKTQNGEYVLHGVIGWIVIGIGILIGFCIILYAISKSGSSSSSYYASAYSMFSGMGVGFGIGTIIVSAISGLGFLGVSEIIQLLQDQKTIMLRKELNKK